MLRNLGCMIVFEEALFQCLLFPIYDYFTLCTFVSSLEFLMAMALRFLPFLKYNDKRNFERQI